MGLKWNDNTKLFLWESNGGIFIIYSIHKIVNVDSWMIKTETEQVYDVMSGF